MSAHHQNDKKKQKTLLMQCTIDESLSSAESSRHMSVFTTLQHNLKSAHSQPEKLNPVDDRLVQMRRQFPVNVVRFSGCEWVNFRLCCNVVNTEMCQTPAFTQTLFRSRRTRLNSDVNPLEFRPWRPFPESEGPGFPIFEPEGWCPSTARQSRRVDLLTIEHRIYY